MKNAVYPMCKITNLLSAFEDRLSEDELLSIVEMFSSLIGWGAYNFSTSEGERYLEIYKNELEAELQKSRDFEIGVKSGSATVS